MGSTPTECPWCGERLASLAEALAHAAEQHRDAQGAPEIAMSWSRCCCGAVFIADLETAGRSRAHIHDLAAHIERRGGLAQHLLATLLGLTDEEGWEEDAQ